MQGKALIDLPAHGLRCGEIGDIPDTEAERLTQDGAFDPRAVTQDEPAQSAKPARKRKE